jgi:RNA recognition motif-containing protein
LPYDVSQQEVSALFTDNGLTAPVRIHLPIGPDGRLRGFGFVTCATADAANQSLNTLRSVDVRGRRLMVNIAHPRGERPPGAAPGMSARPPREGGGFGGAVKDAVFGTKRRQGMIETMAKQTTRTIGTRLGNQIVRGILGSIFGGKR